MKLFCRIKEGKLPGVVTSAMDRFLKSCEGKTVTISIEKTYDHGTPNTHRYYRGYIVPAFRKAFNELGNEFSLEDTHNILKTKFMLRDVVDPGTGEVIAQYVPSTSTFSREDWNGFLENLKRWGAEEFNLYINDPGEQIKVI